MKKNILKLLSLTAAGLIVTVSLAGCGDDSDAIVGSWDNSEEEYSLVFLEDGSVDVSDFYETIYGTYTIDGTAVTIMADGETVNGTVRDGSLIINGMDGTFISVAQPYYIPANAPKEEEPVQTPEPVQNPEPEPIYDMSLWYGEYDNDYGTLSVESSIIDNAVDYEFSMDNGYYMSGTWEMESDDTSVVGDDYLKVSYDDSDHSILVELKDDSDPGDMVDFTGWYFY